MTNIRKRNQYFKISGEVPMVEEVDEVVTREETIVEVEKKGIMKKQEGILTMEKRVVVKCIFKKRRVNYKA
jgi:hypothetical protein